MFGWLHQHQHRVASLLTSLRLRSSAAPNIINGSLPFSFHQAPYSHLIPLHKTAQELSPPLILSSCLGTTVPDQSTDSFALEYIVIIYRHRTRSSQKMPSFNLASVAEAFAILMNTPLVPSDSSKAPKDVQLTEMPISSRQGKEFRRQVNSSHPS